MTMNRFSFAKALLAVTVAAVALLTGCINPKNISVTSFKIDSIKPTGLRSVNGSAKVGVSNTGVEFTVFDITGTVKRKGAEFGTFTIEPVTVAGKSEQVYTVSGSASLVSALSVASAISAVLTWDVEDYTIDISCKIKPRGGVVVPFERKDIPASKIAARLKK